MKEKPLMTILCEDRLLQRDLLLPGILFIKKRDGKFIKICELGEINDAKNRIRFAKLANEFHLEKIVEDQFVFKGQELLTRLDLAGVEVERIRIRAELLALIFADQKGRLLFDLVYMFASVFEIEKAQFQRELSASSISQYKRALVVGSLNVVLALLGGVLDFSILKELFFVAALYDRSILVPTPSYLIEKRLEEIRTSRVSRETFPEFLTHTQFDSSTLLTQFSNKEILELIRFHHENGNGFPKRLNFSELTEVQKIIVMNNEVVPYTELDFKVALWQEWMTLIESSPLFLEISELLNLWRECRVKTDLEEKAA